MTREWRSSATTSARCSSGFEDAPVGAAGSTDRADPEATGKAAVRDATLMSRADVVGDQIVIRTATLEVKVHHLPDLMASRHVGQMSDRATALGKLNGHSGPNAPSSCPTAFKGKPLRSG